MDIIAVIVLKVKFFFQIEFVCDVVWFLFCNIFWLADIFIYIIYIMVFLFTILSPFLKII